MPGGVEGNGVPRFGALSCETMRGCSIVCLACVSLSLGCDDDQAPPHPDMAVEDAAVDMPPPPTDLAMCGKAGFACCAGNACESGGCCVAGSCVASGAMCPGLGAACANGSCGTCGALGQDCCTGS